MASEKVKVFGFWGSPFAVRVEWALKLKGVEYEYIDEDLSNKSPELLRHNPVTKKVPVLVHGEKAIAESLVIVEYIDETWSDGPPILPTDPYERAQARFWAKLSEDKCLPAIYDVYLKTGDDLHEAVKDAQESLRTLEQALEGKKFFGGETIGFVDIIVGWYPFWIRMVEELAGVSIVEDESLPLINAWFDPVVDVLVNERLPSKEETYALNRARREQIISGQLNRDR